MNLNKNLAFLSYSLNLKFLAEFAAGIKHNRVGNRTVSMECDWHFLPDVEGKSPGIEDEYKTLVHIHWFFHGMDNKSSTSLVSVPLSFWKNASFLEKNTSFLVIQVFYRINKILNNFIA